MTRWFFRFPGSFHANGPTGLHSTEREARAEIRRVWKLDKLPPGTEVWRA